MRLRHNEHVAERTGTKPMVIVGGGKAGGTAAVTLREDGFGGPIVIVSGEPGIPFGRPPLSKTYLRSEEDLTGWYVQPADWYQTHDVDLVRSSVTAVDTAAHTGDELAAGAERPDDVSSEAAALWQDRLEQRSKEVLMVRTAVRVIELSTCDVQMFKARHVIGRAGL